MKKYFFNFLGSFLGFVGLLLWPVIIFFAGVILVIIAILMEAIEEEPVFSFSEGNVPIVLIGVPCLVAGALVIALIYKGYYWPYIVSTLLLEVGAIVYLIKRIFHLFRLFCQKVAEGDGGWWILGLLLWPIKVSWQLCHDSKFSLIIKLFILLAFLPSGLIMLGGYLKGILSFQILYIIFLIITGAEDLIFN